ncbi:GDSL-type esterase/lipase family protein [Candidatus Riflebacteria bacterium]
MQQSRLKVFFLLILLSISGCFFSPQLKRIPENAIIIAFGDSLTYGRSLKREHSYPAVLAKLSGMQVLNSGINGEVTSRGLERLPKILKKYKPALVLLCHGGNDILRRYSREETKKNLRKMVGLIKNPGPRWF